MALTYGTSCCRTDACLLTLDIGSAGCPIREFHDLFTLHTFWQQHRGDAM